MSKSLSQTDRRSAVHPIQTEMNQESRIQVRCLHLFRISYVLMCTCIDAFNQNSMTCETDTNVIMSTSSSLRPLYDLFPLIGLHSVFRTINIFFVLILKM